MSSFEQQTEMISRSSRAGMLALASVSGERVISIYENFWVGEHTKAPSLAIDLGWRTACDGEAVPPGDTEWMIRELRELFEFYNEAGIGILAAAVTVALRVAQALAAESDAETALAASRASSSAVHAAVLADGFIAGLDPRRPRPGIAELEERAFQSSAIERIAGRSSVVRDMFSDLGPTPPKWFATYLTASDHI